MSVTVGLQSAPDNAARGDRDQGPLAVLSARPSPISRRRWRTSCASIPRPWASSSSAWRTARRRNRSAFAKATSSFRSTIRRSRNPPILIASRGSAAGMARDHQSRRAADIGHVQRMSAARQIQDTQPVRSRRARSRRAAAAGRQAASRRARRRRRPGSLARSRRHSHPHAGDAFARLAHLLGSAGHRQDHGGAAFGARDRAPFRADIGDLLRRRRSEEGVRCRAGAARDRAGHAALRRRDPPLQPRPAGFVSAGGRGRHHRAGRRDHGKSVFRADRAAAFTRARSGVQAARCRSDREASRTRRNDRRHGNCRSTRMRAPR